MIRQRTQLIGAAAISALVVLGSNLAGSSSLVAAQSTAAATQSAPYTPCVDLKLTAPIASVATPAATMAATTSAAATMAATSAATSAATASAANAGTGDNIAFVSIVGSESEACYVASENFLKGNPFGLPAGFNNPVGVTKTISGDIAIDKTNLANSQVGDISINISQFQSDSRQRDGYIRTHFLESNKYPFATLTNATVLGLPSSAYTDGTPLKFQIKGTLTVHNTPRVTVFDATGALKGDTLVVTATTDLDMSELGVTPPTIPGVLAVDNAVRLVVNLVARPGQATPVATQ